MQSVIETNAYLAAAKDAGMSADEQQAVVDLIAANLVGRGRAFDRDDNELHVYWAAKGKKGGGKALGKDTKANLARALAGLIAQRFKGK